MEVKLHCLRLKPGEDLRKSLSEFVILHKIKAAAVVSCVGSLNKVNLRFASQGNSTNLKGPFEIVSLVGTLSVEGLHLHVSVADKTGRTMGGHLLEGSTIYTTAETVLAELKDVEFTREPDPDTGYNEL